MVSLRAIRQEPSPPVAARNPYRAILRRDYPEPLVALLAFILGIWLWDHHFGETGGYAPGTEHVAIIKIDRDLRLADAMAADPAWLRWVAGVGRPEEVRAHALESFRKLAMEDALGPRGMEAFAVILAANERDTFFQSLGETLRGHPISDPLVLTGVLAAGGGTWWHARLVDFWEKNQQPVSHWRPAYDRATGQLRARAIAVGSSVWLLGLAGLAFVPSLFRRLGSGIQAKPVGYGGAWPPTLGLTVFLLATLAWIGFTMTLELGISALPGLPPLLGIVLDAGARLLPALIAIGLLFRRPSHALRVLGLRGPIYPGMILGIFSLLLLADLVLRWATGYGSPSHPAGGLSPGDAGLWGLAFTVVSACVMAPIAEEILYRGVLFRSLRSQLGIWVSALLSSGIFAILHFYGGYGLASVGLFGFSCALLYAATGSLTSAIVLHMLYNASIKIPEWLIYHSPTG